jgi:hypothetical protein
MKTWWHKAALRNTVIQGVGGLIASGAVVASANGQIIQNLDISAAGDGIDINGKNNVTIRNCRIRHNTAGLGGHGIRESLDTSVTGLVIQDCEIINAGAPARGVSSVDAFSIHKLAGAVSPIIRRVTLRDGTTGIYLLSNSNPLLSFIEVHDVRGPFPRGGAVQLDGCTATANTVETLGDFSYEGIPGTSYEEDIINVYGSTNIRVARGFMPFGSSSVSGQMINFEKSATTDSDGGRCDEIELNYFFNGAIHVKNSDDVQYTNARIRNVLPYSSRGLSASNKLMVGAENDGGHAALGSIVVSALYNNAGSNLSFDDANIGTKTLTSNNWISTRSPIRNAFSWRNTALRPVETLPVRIGGNISNPPVPGETAVLLPGKYANDPTSRTWQWYYDGVAIGGATSMTYTIASGATDVGKVLSVKETVANAAGTILTPSTATLAAVISAPNSNLLTHTESIDNAAWTKLGTLTVTANQASGDGRTMDRLNATAAAFNGIRQGFVYTQGVPYSLSFSGAKGTGRYFAAQIANSYNGPLLPIWDMNTNTFSANTVVGVTGGVTTDDEGQPKCWLTYTPTDGNTQCDICVVTANGNIETALPGAQTMFVNKVKLEQGALTNYVTSSV